MVTLKGSIFRVVKFILGEERSIKIIEYGRGLYRYPKKMLGRNLPSNLTGDSDVLVLAAHPDDEILGLSSTLYKHRMNDEKVHVAYVTNGSVLHGESWRHNYEFVKDRTKERYKEGVQGLSLLGIPKGNIYCLGFPDGGTHRYVEEIANDVLFLIQKLRPKKVYVHCIEGGHNDHDIVSFVVKSICKKINFFSVYEWAEYNPLQPLGTEDIKFISNDNEGSKINLSKKERILKRKMLAHHESQDVEKYFLMGEAIRQVNPGDYEKELQTHSQFTVDKLVRIIDKFTKFIKTVESRKQII